MAVAAVTTKPLDTQLAMPFHPPLPKPLQKKRLPAGRPREWYVSHNRRLKAMRLAIALLDTGVYQPASASNHKIRTTAEHLGIHPPSDTTCRMVRTLIRYGR
ncbi:MULTISPECIES: hypothetical protein [unclassified Streptomyces]|uniref:hypothetical protein n=1 Tax=unclassified Streptomyces TaxID=2593676 RepID=UPI002255A981|nr:MULTISPECIES: hypothetical protein [unclassified Streptomyces]MCX4677795.1 hypothetical protein [Streptomyces sp. NBC_01433]WRZ72032.1 hypothetical protein OG251_10585 [Streptomyces sp. NBC_01237]